MAPNEHQIRGVPALHDQQDLFINGQYRESSDGNKFSVRNPMTGSTLYECASASTEDFETAITGAYAAFRTWSSIGPSARRLVLLKAADILESYFSQDAPELLLNEVSATKTWIRANILGAAAVFRENAALATHIKGEIVPADRPGTTILVNREPVGVVLAISPWNMPVTLTARAICCPLICGNAVLLKPSEFSPKSQHLVVRALREAGLPDGCLQFLPTSPERTPEVTAFAIRHPKVSRANFTGSDRVGRIIGQLSAECLKPCVLELGGKAPVVVLEDADVDEAVEAIRFGLLQNASQVCMATERVIAHKSVVEVVQKKLVQRLQDVNVGNPMEDTEVQVSGLFSSASAARVLKLVTDAVDQGATLLAGDLELHGPCQTILKPHILANVTNKMDVFHRESFGPVLFVNSAESEADAIAQANDSEYTLCASVFSRDILRAADVGKQIRAGSCHVNGPTIYIEPPLPNGGVGGASGYGRFGGVAGIEEFTERQIVTLARPGMIKYAL